MDIPRRSSGIYTSTDERKVLQMKSSRPPSLNTASSLLKMVSIPNSPKARLKGFLHVFASGEHIKIPPSSTAKCFDHNRANGPLTECLNVLRRGTTSPWCDVDFQVVVSSRESILPDAMQRVSGDGPTNMMGGTYFESAWITQGFRRIFAGFSFRKPPRIDECGLITNL